MIRSLAAAMTLAILMAAGSVRAEEDAEIRAAQQSVHEAEGHLRSAPHDYGGHRKNALGHLERASNELQAALRTANQRDQKIEQKEKKLEQRQDKIDHQLNNLKKREAQ